MVTINHPIRFDNNCSMLDELLYFVDEELLFVAVHCFTMKFPWMKFIENNDDHFQVS